MERGAMVAAIEASWRQLDAAVAGLDAAAMTEPGVVEEWSVKDLLGHVATWEQAALSSVEQWRRGEPPAGLGGVSMDSFNAGEAAKRRDWPLARVQEDAAATRQRLRAAVESLTDDDWAAMSGEGEQRRSVGDWVGGALGGALGPGTHAAEHAQHIWAWRAMREQRCAEQITALTGARAALLRALDGLSDGDLLRPGMEGEWSVRDALAHIAAWDRQVVRCIEAWLDGATPPALVPDVDAFNAQVTSQAREQSMASTLVALARTHEDLLALVQRASGRGDEFQYPWGGHGDLHQAITDGAAHEREHTDVIVAWRKSNSL